MSHAPARSAPATMNQRLILQGDLSAIELADLLTFLSMIRGSGRLELRRSEFERTIHWNRGEVVFATSSSPEHALGQFLLRNGKITVEQHRRSLEMLTEGTRLGKLLVQLGYLSPKDLWWSVKHQVLEIIYSLFSWKEGSFSFFETDEELGERITLSINTSTIIMEGVRRLDEGARIREKIPDLEVPFARVPGAEAELDQLEISAAERGVYDRIDGTRTVRDLIRVSEMPEFEVTHILYRLLTARLIESVPAETVSRPVFLDVEDSPDLLKVVSTYNEMFQRLFAALSASIGEQRAHEVFVSGLQSADTDELWTGIFFDREGRFDENMLIANISELPFERRKKSLDEGLNTLLSIQLFEASQFLDPVSRVDVFRFISDRKAQLEAAR